MFTTLLAFALGAPALKDDPKKGTDLVGEWVIESVVYGSRPRAPQKDPLRYVFTADGTWAIYRGERKQNGERGYRHDPDADPPQITLKHDAAEQDGPESVGIYRVEGATLTLCYNRAGVAKRPTEFASPPGTGISLVVLKRARPKD